jgi:TonB family protein
MLSQLLESAPPPRRRSPGWTLASSMAHIAVIGGAIVATTRPTTVAAVTAVPQDTIIFVKPVPPSRGTPPATVTGTTAPPVPRTPPPIDVRVPRIETTFDPSKPVTASQGAQDPFGPGLQTSATPYGGDHVAAPGGVFTGASVDRIAAQLGGNPTPEYPRSLRTSALEGDVLVTFVVDTTGRVAPGSITIVQSTHELFADAVRRWLPRTRYSPAEIRGAKVKQLVQQRIEFSMQR